MASSSGRKSGSSGRSTKRKRVVIGAEETVRVRYRQDSPEVESERKAPRGKRQTDSRKSSRPAAVAGRKLSNSKREQREHRQRMLRGRRTALAAAALALVVLTAWGTVALYRAPILPVKNVEVSGAAHYDRSAVLSIAEIPEDATMLRLPARAIEASLEADPWIASADVKRRLPGTVRITVDERKAVAVVDAGGDNVVVVSADRHWLGKKTAGDANLVAISSVETVSATPGSTVKEPEVLNAIAVIEGLSPELRKIVASVSAPSVDETAIITTDDVEIFVGEAANMEEKNRIVQEILATHEGVVYINVRVVDRPTWRGLGDD